MSPVPLNLSAVLDWPLKSFYLSGIHTIWPDFMQIPSQNGQNYNYVDFGNS